MNYLKKIVKYAFDNIRVTKIQKKTNSDLTELQQKNLIFLPMNTVGWTRRSSNAGPFRTSNPPFNANDGGVRQSRSVERHSRIPLRSSSCQAPYRCGPSAFQQNRERGKSQAPNVVGDTPVGAGKITPSQSNFGSRMTSSCSSNRTLKKASYSKDMRNLHDKEYLKEAGHIVQRFFQQKCPEIIVNGVDIKPMTIKMFIGMVNFLFATLEIVDKRQEPVIFESNTYEKELPYWMKKLNYPGLINKAWLLTVNVPNNWHHVIGLLSWLVKICEISSLYNFEDQIQTDDMTKMWEYYYFKQSLRAYRLFNEGTDEEYNELCSEVVQKFYELNRVDENENKSLEEEIEELRQKLENPNALAEKDELDEAVQKLKNLELVRDKIIDDIAKKEDEIEMKKTKILEKEENCDFLKKAIMEKRKELENLKNIVSEQPTSMSEIVELQKKSKNLDKEIKFLEKECDDLSQLISRYEYESAVKRDAILQATHAFNRNIIQLVQIIPELKEFRIYKDPEDEEIISEMENAVASLTDLRKKKIEFYEGLKMDIKNTEEGIEAKVQALKNITKVISKLEESNEIKRRKNLALQEEFEEKEKLIKEESFKWDEKLKAIEGKVKELNELKEKKQKLELRYEQLCHDLEKTEELAERFWEKAVEKWKNIPEKLETLLELVNQQNTELKNGYSQLMTAFQP